MLQTTVRFTLALAAAMLLLACGGDEKPDPPEPAAEAAPAQEAAPEAAAKPAMKPSEEPPGNKGVQKEMDPDGETVTLKGTDPSGRPFRARVGMDVEVPDDFPEDVPIYPGAEPMATMTAEGHGSFVSFRTEDAQEDIYDFYLQQLPSEGWSIQDENNFRGQLKITSKKDIRQLVVTIAGTEGDARVSVVVTEEE